MDYTPGREPDELTSIEIILEAKLAELHTCLPGKIERYDHAKQQADVKPTLKRVYLDEEGAELEVEYPVITNVPVAFPRGGGFSVSYPLKKGDPVWLIVAERSVDGYLETDGATPIDPKDARKHDVTDVVCYPGGGTFANASAIASETDLVIGLEDEKALIHITPAGELWVKAGKVKLGAEDAAKALALAEEVKDRLDTIQGAFDGHVHTGNMGAPTTPPLAPIGPLPGVASTKVFTDA